MAHPWGKGRSLRRVLGPCQGCRRRAAVGARRSRRLLSLRDTARAMSQENVEIVRRAWEYEIFGRGGGDDPLADFAPGVVMTPVEEEPSYGREAIRENLQRFETAWEELEVTAEQFID